MCSISITYMVQLTCRAGQRVVPRTFLAPGVWAVDCPIMHLTTCSKGARCATGVMAITAHDCYGLVT